MVRMFIIRVPDCWHRDWIEQAHGVFLWIDLMTTTEGKLNYHDGLISLTMQEKNLVQIATFDRDFKEIDWVQVVSA